MPGRRRKNRRSVKTIGIIVQYIAAALADARYEKIEDEEPFYGKILGLRGVWATGRTEDECRAHLAEALDGWLPVRLGEKRTGRY